VSRPRIGVAEIGDLGFGPEARETSRLCLSPSRAASNSRSVWSPPRIKRTRPLHLNSIRRVFAYAGSQFADGEGGSRFGRRESPNGEVAGIPRGDGREVFDQLVARSAGWDRLRVERESRGFRCDRSWRGRVRWFGC